MYVSVRSGGRGRFHLTHLAGKKSRPRPDAAWQPRHCHRPPGTKGRYRPPRPYLTQMPLAV